MPLPLLRPCVAALKELVRNYRCSVVLCTATQPALNAGPSGTKVGFPGGFTKVRELALDDVPRLFADLRRVTLRHIGMQSDTDLAERFAASPQALCIVNQRAHARALFRAIRHLPGARHLSTCMHSVHRARVLAEIRIDLEHKRPCRVVSTSLVEAGVDIDFPLVLRAEAGLDQIAQAAGRCNREFRATAEESEVLVFQSPDYGVIQALKANAEAGREIMLDHPEDPFAPDIMKSFFELLYWRRGEAELDNGRVLEDCHDHAGDLNFPFEKIAKAMRFIDDTMVPVIVPVEDDGAVAGLLKELQWVKGVGRIARKLGRFTVGVPRKVRNRMLAQRVAERVRGEDFGDQFGGFAEPRSLPSRFGAGLGRPHLHDHRKPHYRIGFSRDCIDASNLLRYILLRLRIETAGLCCSCTNLAAVGHVNPRLPADRVRTSKKAKSCIPR